MFTSGYVNTETILHFFSIRESNTLSIFRENLMAFYHDKFNVDFLKFYTVLYLIISPFIISSRRMSFMTDMLQ